MNGRKTVWMNFPLNCVNRARSVCYIETLKTRGRIVFILEKWNWMTPQRIHAIHPWVCVVRLCTEMLVSFVRASLSLYLLVSFCLNTTRWIVYRAIFGDFPCTATLYIALWWSWFSSFYIRSAVSLFEHFMNEIFMICFFPAAFYFSYPLWFFNSFIRSRALKLSIILMNEIIIIEWLKATTALSNCKW